MIDTLKTYDTDSQLSICNILGKLAVSIDPTDIVKVIYSLLSQRIYLMEKMLDRKNVIGLTPIEFLKILQSLVKLSLDNVNEILVQDPLQWYK